MTFSKLKRFGLAPKRGEKHESDETTASVDRVAKLGLAAILIAVRGFSDALAALPTKGIIVVAVGLIWK